MNNEKLNALVEQYQAMRVMATEAKAQQDAIAGQIKEIMEAEDMREYFAPTGKATYKEVTSHPLDQAAIKRERPEIAERYTIDRVTRPLKVS